MKIKFLPFFTGAIMLLAISCLAVPTLPRSGVSSTPTTTKVLGAIEATSSPDESPTLTKSGASCLDNPNGTFGEGSPCIRGTYDAHYDITTETPPSQTDHVVSPLQAEFQLWAVAPGQLQGIAHLTYSLNATLLDTEATGCKVQTEIVKPFNWDVNLDGQYFTQPGGGVQVLIQAYPSQGPSYTETFENCQIPEQKAPGVTWAGLSGQLNSGVFDFRQDNPLPPNSTGEFYTVIHMEVVP